MKKTVLLISTIAMALLLVIVAVPGCSSGESIMVYSGAGMRQPMDEIGAAFEEEYDVEVTYNYGGSQTLLSQMELTQKGDAYMPGATMYIETATEKGLIDADYQELICYHVPVIVVPKGNPANITCLADMANEGVELIWGDPEAAAIGKTGVSILNKNGIYDEVWANVLSLEPTMNEVMLKIALGQADASVNWWDTVKSVEDIDVIEIPNEQNAIKVIPIGITTFTEHPENAKNFVDFCASDEGKAIFAEYGFTIYPDPKYES